ncbi:hypothetical protein JN00_0077 [Metamycoplasma subdolum]|uniref:RNAP delta factor n=1 Tax=Metamycoplasma subdolum TaxID=92407 RepID=A0A3M0AIU5_9BACT|nr:hypothetical protein [Metamycoplasma subdolum]RMA79032.1 hypothetical protein JN00_0077 [Metamycoplasma subdolum]WPB50555.1 hypothetical protein R9C05_00105 [Metamycoplasma subdolum]
MNTMVDVARKALKANQDQEFHTLFETVKSELFNRWKEESNPSLTDEELLEIKRGELYKLLTIDGHFYRNDDGTWTTIRPEI